MKKILNFALIFCMVMTVFSSIGLESEANSTFSSATTQTFSVSGDLTMSQPTRKEIAEKYSAITAPTEIFEEEPSASAPYYAGKLSESMLKNGLDLLNYFRFTAKLPPVQLSETMTNEAQHGATVLAAIDQLTHYPYQPDDMSDEFYRIGALSTSSSNISYNYGYFAPSSIEVGLMGCLFDEDYSNIDRVGHRRWLLNPPLSKVGIGYAKSESGSNYSTMQVFDWSGREVDYDFISFPASGNFPQNLFNQYVPWSVSLNPQRFQKPQLNNITVTVTRQSDGTSWTLDSSTGAPTSSGAAYLGVNNDGYGVSNCIIFSPGAFNLESCAGAFTVEINGLKTLNGNTARLLYEVDFFDTDSVQSAHTCQYTTTVAKPLCNTYGYTTYVCETCGDYYFGNIADAIGHETEWKINPDNTKEKVCKNCHKVFQTLGADEFIPNDINGDNKFNVFDYYIVKTIYFKGTTNEAMLKRADVNGDGKVNVFDYRMVKMAYFEQ